MAIPIPTPSAHCKPGTSATPDAIAGPRPKTMQFALGPPLAFTGVQPLDPSNVHALPPESRYSKVDPWNAW